MRNVIILLANRGSRVCTTRPELLCSCAPSESQSLARKSNAHISCTAASTLFANKQCLQLKTHLFSWDYQPQRCDTDGHCTQPLTILFQQSPKVSTKIVAPPFSSHFPGQPGLAGSPQFPLHYLFWTGCPSCHPVTKHRRNTSRLVFTARLRPQFRTPPTFDRCTVPCRRFNQNITSSVVLLQQCHCQNRHRGKLQNLSPPSVLFKSTPNFFTIHRRHRRKK